MKRTLWKGRIDSLAYMVTQIDEDLVIVEVHHNGKWEALDDDIQCGIVLGVALIRTVTK